MSLKRSQLDLAALSSDSDCICIIIIPLLLFESVAWENGRPETGGMI